MRSLGIYPVGSLVMMNSGRLGVVIEQSAGSLITPKVKVFFSSKSNMPIIPEIIDLSKAGNNAKILSREDPLVWKFSNLTELWTGMSGQLGNHYALIVHMKSSQKPLKPTSEEVESSPQTEQISGATFENMGLQAGDRLQVQMPKSLGVDRAIVRLIGFLEPATLLITTPTSPNGTYLQLLEHESLVIRTF